MLQVLDEAAGPDAAAAGFDFVVLTGGAETGRRVLHAAAETLTPAAMELSGVDAVFVLEGADLGLVAASLAYGLRLNGGADLHRAAAGVRAGADGGGPALAGCWRNCRRRRGAGRVAPPAGRVCWRDAERAGRSRRCAQPGRARRRPARRWRCCRKDVFAPWLALVPVRDEAAALEAADFCPLR